MPNIYYDVDLSYELDQLVVWKHATGKLYAAQDSGCSCPTPFEDEGPSFYLDADDKTRQIAREALKPYPEHPTAKES